MSEPTYGGNEIFGDDYVIRIEPNERAHTKHSHFGYNGNGQVDGGMRGTAITVEGTHSAPNGLALANLHADCRRLHDGRGRTFHDGRGLDWPDTVMDGFEPLPPVETQPGSGLVWQRYRIGFLCLRGHPQ